MTPPPPDDAPAAAAPTPHAAGATARRNPRAIATVCLSGTLPDKLEAIAAAGFEGVEVFENDLLTYDGTPAEAGRLARDLGLAVVLYQPFRDFEAVPDAARRARNLDRAERKFDAMAALGADLVLVCSNVGADTLDDPARAADDLRAMAERAAARGMRVGYEALAWGRRVRTWREAWDVVSRADHPALGLIVDSFHTLALGDDPAGIAALRGELVFFVQLADAPRLAMDVLSWSRHHRAFPLQGDLDVGGFLRAVLASGYAGPLSLEVFNDEFRAAPARATARDAMRGLMLAEEAAGLPVAPPIAATLAGGVPAAPLPPPPRLAGTGFVEFAVDDAASRVLGAHLAALGFARVGAHRSKAVALWRAGAVDLVLNAEPDSAASEHFEMHGPSVCALGLRVAGDADAAAARAAALLAPAWRERRGEGERRLPAIRAPDGTLVLLLGPAQEGAGWEADFDLDPAAAAAARAAPYAGVDHLAQAVAPGAAMDAHALFWRGVFGLAPDAPLELPDPYGLVRSRALSDPSGAVRVALNASEATRTATGRFVSAASGAGVHHVALAAPDASAALAAAVARGAEALPVPENYYDDLDARLGLGAARLAALARAGVLYDAEGPGRGGEFLHGYLAPPFPGRFFFEVAERRGGYRGYGAANAGVRLAALARLERTRASAAAAP